MDKGLMAYRDRSSAPWEVIVSKLSWHLLSATCCTAAIVAGCLSCHFAVAEDKGSVVVASNGGRCRDPMRQANIKPFEGSTGITRIQGSGRSFSKVQTVDITDKPTSGPVAVSA